MDVLGTDSDYMFVKSEPSNLLSPPVTPPDHINTNDEYMSETLWPQHLNADHNNTLGSIFQQREEQSTMFDEKLSPIQLIERAQSQDMSTSLLQLLQVQQKLQQNKGLSQLLQEPNALIPQQSVNTPSTQASQTPQEQVRCTDM